MQVVAPPSVAGQTERCRRWRHHSFPSSGAAGGHTGARKQSADRVYISSQPCRVLCPPPPAPVETSPAAAAGASLETRRLLSEERAAQAPEEESGPERGPTRHRGGGPLSPPRAPAVPHFSAGPPRTCVLVQEFAISHARHAPRVVCPGRVKVMVCCWCRETCTTYLASCHTSSCSSCVRS